MNEQKQITAQVNRRNFLRNSGFAGLGLAGVAMAGKELGFGSTAVQAAGPTATDIEVLQFALNLEYLEAEFYCYAITGKSLEANGVAVSGSVGTAGATTGGAAVPSALLNSSPSFKATGEQLMRDEVDHVLLLRSALGSEYTIAKPAINLAALGAMNDPRTFLIMARDLEVTGVSAYGGAITLLSQAVLQTAAQIALVEGIHVGNLQLLVGQNGLPVTPLDSLDVVPPPSGTNYFDDTPGTSLAIIRTTSEVLAIVYGSETKGTKKGGFFPNGVNGPISTV